MTAWRVAVAATVLAIWAQAQTPAPVLRILEPTIDTIMTGEVAFRIGLTGATATQVQVQVDGVEVCRIEQPPFQCTWDAGRRLDARTVRVVVMTSEGQRLTAGLRTKGVLVSDRSDVVAILVSAHVTDGRGRFVPGLTAADFRVLEDGVEQKVTLLDTGEGGAEILVALDVSGSMEPAMDDLKAVVRDFLGRLRPELDRTTLAGFNSAFFVLADRNADRAAQMLAIDELGPSGGTAIYDTIISGAEVVAAHPGRRALVVFTDGDDMSSRSTLESARAALHAQDALLYLVATGKADSDPTLRRRLSDLADETGGAAYFSRRLSGTAEHFREIVQDLRQQYLLSFSPERPLGDGKWRTLKVEVKNKSLRVRARSGYFANRRD